MIDLASERVGGRILGCNDEFFAPAENLIKVSDPVANDEYTDRGKWMDGWETRRRREPGHDWCVIALGIPGRVRRVIVDTANFTGNYPEQFSLEGAGIEDPDQAEWVELLPRTALLGDSEAVFAVDAPHRIEIVRLSIHPDGGVARLRVEGDPLPAMELVCSGQVDLAAASVGGEAIDASDVHYSHPSNLLRPVASAGMWDGWETKRRRDEGHDWVTIRLGIPGSVAVLTVDTTHFRGNAPGWVSCDVSEDGETWTPVLDRVPVDAHRVNHVALGSPARAGLVKLSIHPDGGLARLRVLGRPDPAAATAKRLEYLNALLEQPAGSFFRTACASSRFVGAMISSRPHQSVEEVLASAESAFDGLAEADWLEAFAGHPRIGERGDSVAHREQAGTENASRATLRELVDVNRRYEEKFGFTYIVYATGKSAEEMLDNARERLGNDREEEIVNAAREQRKISATRLRRMLCQEPR